MTQKLLSSNFFTLTRSEKATSVLPTSERLEAFESMVIEDSHNSIKRLSAKGFYGKKAKILHAFGTLHRLQIAAYKTLTWCGVHARRGLETVEAHGIVQKDSVGWFLIGGKTTASTPSATPPTYANWSR